MKKLFSNNNVLLALFMGASLLFMFKWYNRWDVLPHLRSGIWPAITILAAVLFMVKLNIEESRKSSWWAFSVFAVWIGALYLFSGHVCLVDESLYEVCNGQIGHRAGIILGQQTKYYVLPNEPVIKANFETSLMGKDNPFVVMNNKIMTVKLGWKDGSKVNDIEDCHKQTNKISKKTEEALASLLKQNGFVISRFQIPDFDENDGNATSEAYYLLAPKGWSKAKRDELKKSAQEITRKLIAGYPLEVKEVEFL